MKAATYARSSKDRADMSIDAQQRQLAELAASRGIPIVAQFSDAVLSGKDDDRPGFQSLIRELKNPRRGWDTILVLDTSRIARRRHLAIIFEESECKKAGVRVIYKSLPESDPITEMLLKSILQAMDEWHSLTSIDAGPSQRLPSVGSCASLRESSTSRCAPSMACRQHGRGSSRAGPFCAVP